MKYQVYGMGYGLVAECENSADAAYLMSLYGEGSHIKYNEKVFWHEGGEEFLITERSWKKPWVVSMKNTRKASDIIEERCMS